MKSIRNITLSALLTIGAFTMVTFTACNPDPCKDVVCNNGGTCILGTCDCTVGYSGTSCDTEVRESYFFTYKGNGTDSDGDTYTNWGLKFERRSDDAKNMVLTVLDSDNAPVVALNVMLLTNNTYEIEQKVDGTTTYTGNGSIDTDDASLSLAINDSGIGGSSYTVNFTNMLKQ